MAIALKKRMCLSLSDFLETEPVMGTEEPLAALHDAMLAAFVFVVAAFFVAS